MWSWEWTKGTRLMVVEIGAASITEFPEGGEVGKVLPMGGGGR